MKETKVYVDELPESCSKCEWCTLNHKDNYGRPFCLIARMPLYNGDKIKEERGQHKASLSDFDCPLVDIKAHDRELVKEVCENIIKFINELAWKDVQYDAFQSTIGEFSGSTSAIPRYAKKYFDLWKEMFGEDLENKG